MAIRSLTILLIGAVCYVLAMATQNGWLYLFAGFTWGVGLISVLMAWSNLRNLEFTRTIIGPTGAQPGADAAGISEDDELQVGITIHNRGFIPKYYLRITEFCPLEEPGKEARAFFLTSLGPRASVRVAYPVKCYRRGEFTFGPVNVESSGPFGLFKLNREFVAPLSALVYPASHPLGQLPLSGNIWSDVGGRLKVRAGSLFCGSREYQPGDSLRHIHWRNSARCNKLMVKEFEGSSRNSLAITFDARGNLGQGKETTLEYAIKIAASAARYCSRRGMRVRLLPAQGSLLPADTSTTLIMEFLARLEPGDSTNLDHLLEQPRVPDPILAIVSLADPRGPDIVQELSTKTRLLIVVALTGFAEREPSEGVSGNPSPRNTIIIPCRRGELQAALSALETAHRKPGRRIQETPIG